MNPGRPFRFRLHRVKRVREHRRRECELNLLGAEARCRELADALAGVVEERGRALAQLERDRAAGPDPGLERAAWRYLDALDRRETERRAALREAEEHRDARRSDLMLALREVRVLELLEERQREAHRREAGRAEARQLDTLVGDHPRWRRGGSSSAGS